MTATLLTNARIYTRVLPAPEALVIDEGRIVWLGSASQAKAFAHLPSVDCQGGWLAPAFADAHVHATNTGLELTALNLKDCSSAESLAVQVQMHVSASTKVVIGHGWDDTGWSRPPSLNDLQTGLPTYLSRVDVHSALINQPLIRLCPGIESLEGWQASGVVSQAAHALARRTALGLLTTEDKRRAQTAFVNEALANGIVAVDEMSGPVVASTDDAVALKEVASENLDVFIWWGELFGVDTAREIGAYGAGGDLFVDGSFGSKTALVSEPYNDGGAGVEYISYSEALLHINKSVEAGLPVGFHAIGDAATDIVTRAFQAAAESWGTERLIAGRHRIEHAEFLVQSQLEICRELGITLSMQPQFDELWASPSGMYEQRLGERYQHLNDFSSAAKHGVNVVFGSDAPVTALSPWRSISAAVNTHNPRHSISLASAFTAHTRAFWRNHGVLDCGTIEIGALASLALWQVEQMAELRDSEIGRRWSADPRSGHQPLPDLSGSYPVCLKVWNRGRLVYQREEL